MTTEAPRALIQETFPGGPSLWWRFRDPVRVIETRELGGVVPALAAVEEAVAAGLEAVGFLAYEAAAAFDSALETMAPGPLAGGSLPLAWWALFEAAEEAQAPAVEGAGPLPELDWRPLVGRERYEDSVRRIRDAIARGDTYQVNYTFPLEAAFDGDAFALFAALERAQRGGHAAFVDTGRFAVCSASPELFFSLEGERIVTRPMKGTARRGRYPDEDLRRRRTLAESAKERAENVMIVDMARNDLARIARPGSVVAEELFRVETYPTVHQLTSTVAARTTAPVVEILRALFPAASITGAPKISTSRIIRRLEAAPRGVYTGTVGRLSPGRRAHFNVAIRTATVDRASGRVRYGTGGGIVWDSEPEAEYEECRTKAFVLRAAPPAFDLLETLLWRPRSGYFLLARHLERMAASAGYFGWPWREAEARRRLAAAARGFGGARTRVRLLLDSSGALSLEAEAFPCAGRTEWTIGLDERPTDSSDVFLFHKTTHRAAQDEARRRRPDGDEVVLWNERRELTETTRANLVVKVGGEYLTPPVDCGLLAGTYRAELLSRGRLREAVLPIDTLEEAEEVFLVNSVRGWIRTRRRPPAGRSDRMAPARTSTFSRT
jgi:para-aminobenzoate synthetase/4-amino-4-deoxychorismate lyase